MTMETESGELSPRRLPLLLRLGLLMLVVGTVAVASAGLIQFTSYALGWIETGMGRTCGTVVEVDHISGAKSTRTHTYVHYMAGQGFIGIGDDAYTKVRRDVVAPPLREGDTVSFKDDFPPKAVKRQERSC